MPYTLLADLTALMHLGFVAFVAVGGFLAWRYPVVVIAHVPSVMWALGIVAVGWRCPLTDLEQRLRLEAGTGGYSGAFLDRYVTGVLYPERYVQVAQALVAAAVLASYAGLRLRHRSRTDLWSGMPGPHRQIEEDACLPAPPPSMSSAPSARSSTSSPMHATALAGTTAWTARNSPPQNPSESAPPSGRGCARWDADTNTTGR